MTEQRKPRRKRNGLLHQRIAQELQADIESGVYADGDPFPSELSLVEHYGVSRVTVRSALALLEEEGLIRRRRGSGTVVHSKVYHKVLRNIVDFHHEAEMIGRTPSSRVLFLGPRESRIRERLAFNIPPGEPVMELKRLRLLDGAPVALQTSSHPRELLEGVEPADLEDRSLYVFLKQERGVVIREAEQVIEPVNIGPREAELLEIPSGTAVILAHRITREASGRSLELAENLIRGDYIKYTFRLRAMEVVD